MSDNKVYLDNSCETAPAPGAASESNEAETTKEAGEISAGFNAHISPFSTTAASRLSDCCHGGAKMSVLAYSRGKREINQYFSIQNAKLLALVAVLLLIVFHSVSRNYGGLPMGTSLKPDIIVLGAATWSIKLHNGNTEALHQYKTNLTSIARLLEKLAEHIEVIWVLQDPVLEDHLSEDRKMITNQQIDLYNEAALSILSSINSVSKAKVQILRASRLAAEQTISKSLDGLHLPRSTRDISAMVLMNYFCNKILKPIDGSCCLPRPPLTLIQKLTACFFLLSISGYLAVNFICRSNHRENKPATDIESGEEKKPSIAISSVAGLKIPFQSVCKLGLIMAYFYFCDRADIFMKEQKFYTHSSFFIPLIFILVLGFFYNENSKEAKLLNREQTDEWKGWMQLVILIYHISGASAFLPVYMHVRVLVAAYLFQTGYGHFSFFWLKGDFGLYRVCQILAFILIRNIPGYARSVYSSFFAWFGKISLELFICQYHIWLAADTKGILVLIPGNPMLNIIISTFIFVCVAHEISQITNELAQIAIPKDGSALLKRLLGGAGFLLVVLLLSTQEDAKL
ncbi:CAS1 domain-containing protein 1 [Acipenser ruthenus]|uniref:CAS1 domain-containing protein 1 n=1 Tax=Acipenser ruthenus TaxID=7906 RepID=A0A444UAP3_ACIRT|nr:CAS1 domain-containing protein 1 [Acipenser ruthenus]